MSIGTKFIITVIILILVMFLFIIDNSLNYKYAQAQQLINEKMRSEESEKNKCNSENQRQLQVNTTCEQLEAFNTLITLQKKQLKVIAILARSIKNDSESSSLLFLKSQINASDSFLRTWTINMRFAGFLELHDWIDNMHDNQFTVAINDLQHNTDFLEVVIEFWE